jgi:hypothetical protein
MREWRLGDKGIDWKNMGDYFSVKERTKKQRSQVQDRLDSVPHSPE